MGYKSQPNILIHNWFDINQIYIIFIMWKINSEYIYFYIMTQINGNKNKWWMCNINGFFLRGGKKEKIFYDQINFWPKNKLNKSWNVDFCDRHI